MFEVTAVSLSSWLSPFTYLWLSVILYVSIRQYYFSPISNIPGPRLGGVGTFFQVWHVFKGRINHTLFRLHQKHGPFVRISYNEVSVCHPDALQILAAPIWKAPFYNPMAVPNSSYNNLMSERDPKKYGPMRSDVASAFTMTSVIKIEPTIDKLIQLFELRLNDTCKQEHPIDLGSWLHFLTYDILGEILFSSQFGFVNEGRDVGRSIKNNFYLSTYITSIVYMQWLHSILLGNPILRWLDFQPNEHTFNTAIKGIATRKAHTEARVDMMEHWLNQHKKKPDKFTAKDLSAYVTMTLGAGGGTMGSLLEAFFYFLLKEDPKYMRRLQHEVDNAQLSPVISFAEAQQLPYLQFAVSKQ